MTSLRHLRPVFALFWSGDRRMLAYGALMALVTALAGIALLGLSGWFITATYIAGATVATALAFDVFMPSAGIRLLALGRTFSRYGERLTTHDATLRVLARLRERLFRGFALPEVARSLTARPSRLLFRLTVDIDALDSLYLRVIVPVVAAAGAALAVAVALAFVEPMLGLATGVLLVAGGLGIPFLASRRAAASARRRAHALEALRSRTIDLVRGQADLAMANRLGAQVRAIQAADGRLAEADRALNRTESGVSFAIAILGGALLAAMLVAVAFMAEAGANGAPIATFAVLLALASLEPFAALRRGAVEFGRTLQAARRLGPQLAQPPRRKRMTRPTHAARAIQLHEVSLRHEGADRAVLADVSLTVTHGQRIALVGASGAGKSTLLALLGGEATPTTGRIAAATSGLLTQRTELFRDTLRGNLRLAKADADDAELSDALEAAGLGESLDTQLGEGGAGLSAGQGRRLALARLLLSDAPLWLLDEPTEGLDGDTARDVLRRLDEKAENRTLVIATHTRREAALADRLLVLRDGHIAADLARGTPEFDAILDQMRPD